ncbi:DUF1361 domain-containing protein [Oscillatoria sp. FACHB-1406]|uniref:DUF1361 domain-containing protein n=1 Tax=Oscillatoria sp. FACHB-1406 TaxID=2692846 RepID=UPI001F5574DB|nr:DUF1361 domain-containing protein [Oscillatoria sp. FACHB-1406]
MLWNSFLAYIPLALSIWLFRLRQPRSVLWWLGFVVFVAFLPNAPYVLTDIIHLVDIIRDGYPLWVVTLVLIPQYILFIGAGFEAYVLSIINLGYYLHRHKLGQWTLLVELSLHALSALGIYLGRFKRFNSWDIVTKPKVLAKTTIEHLADKEPLLVMFLTFIILTILYWIMKQITLSLIFRWRYRKTLQAQMAEELV